MGGREDKLTDNSQPANYPANQPAKESLCCFLLPWTRGVVFSGVVKKRKDAFLMSCLLFATPLLSRCFYFSISHSFFLSLSSSLTISLSLCLSVSLHTHSHLHSLHSHALTVHVHVFSCFTLHNICCIRHTRHCDSLHSTIHDTLLHGFLILHSFVIFFPFSTQNSSPTFHQTT